MLNVLKRLSELDAGNSNVKSPMVDMPVKSIAEGANGELPQLPELNDLSTLQALSGVKKIDECGPMGMMGGAPMPGNTPASFSINASAASGDEVANMLTQIMTLAGAKPLGGGDAPQHEPGSEPATHDTTPGSGGEVMRGMMDKLNDPNPEDEGAKGGAIGAGLGALAGGPVGAAIGGGIGGALEDEGAPDSGGSLPAMADEVRDMADQLADTDKEELNLETYDNTPNSPFNVGPTDTNARAYQPNTGSADGRGFASNPRAMTAEQVEQQLYADYKAFVNEGKKAKKDYDGDGKIESNKDEVWGSRAKAAAKSGKPFKKA